MPASGKSTLPGLVMLISRPATLRTSVSAVMPMHGFSRVAQSFLMAADCARMPVFDDGRKHKRQKREAVDLLWLVEGRKLAGKGRLIDISLNGLCVEVNSTNCPVQANLTLF